MQLKVKHSTKKAVLAAYSCDASMFSLMPKMVVWPKNKDEVVEVVDYCLAQHLHITPRGAGTSLTGGALSGDGIIVDMCSMKKVDVDEQWCQPGITINELNKALSAHEKLFPIVPASEKACTMGGAVSTNAGGLRMLKDGKTDKWIESVEFVDGTGKVHKNRDVIGTEGTVGIITKIWFKTRKIENEDFVKIVRFAQEKDKPERIMEVVEHIKKQNVNVLEIIDASVSKLANLGNHTYVFAMSSSPIDVEGDETINADEFMEKREGLHSVVAKAGHVFTEDPFVPLDKMPSLLQFLRENNIPFFGHIGAGIIHPAFTVEQRDLIKKMYDLVLSLGGKVSGEHGYGIKKAAYYPAEQAERIKVLKKKYDPHNIMHPHALLDKHASDNIKMVMMDNGCVKCGLCRSCPIVRVVRNECYAPRAKIADPTFAYTCSLCRLCMVECPLSVDVESEIIKMRSILIKHGNETESNKKMIENIKKYKNPFGKDFSPGEWYCC